MTKTYKFIQMGFIRFYPPWKRWILQSYEATAWSSDCLLDVVDFISALEHNGCQ